MGADALRAYLSGAYAVSAPQPSCRRSLGGNGSSTPAESYSISRPAAIRGLRIDYVAGMCGIGLGRIVATEAGVRWAPPRALGIAGNQFGAVVSLTKGTPAVLYGPAGYEGDWIEVTRTSDYVPTGQETVQVMNTLNNVVGGSDFYDSSAVRFRCVMFQAVTEVTALRFWCEAGATIRIGIGYPTNGALELIADENTRPAGVTWYNVTEDPLYGLLITAGNWIGLWIERTPGAEPAPVKVAGIRYRFSSGGITCDGALRGAWREGQSASARYEVYVGDGADPDISGTPDFVGTESPIAIGTGVAGHSYHVAVLRRNAWGLRTTDLAASLRVLNVDDSGRVLKRQPRGPELVKVTPAESGRCAVHATYFPGKELPDVAGLRATSWLLYVRKDGTDPDPSVDAPVVYGMTGSGVFSEAETLLARMDASALEEQPIRVLLRTRRVDSMAIPDTDPVEYEDVNRDSENTDVHEILAQWYGPIAVNARGYLGQSLGIEPEPVYGPETVWIDEARGVGFELREGSTRLFAGATTIWTLEYDGAGHGALVTGFAIVNEAIDGAIAVEAPFEIGTWDESAKIIFFNVRGTRRMWVDVVAGEIHCGAISQVETIAGSVAPDPAWRKWGSTCFQVWGPVTRSFGTPMQILLDGTVEMRVPIEQR